MRAVRGGLEEAGIAIESADVTQIPMSTVAVEESAARQVLRLIDARNAGELGAHVEVRALVVDEFVVGLDVGPMSGQHAGDAVEQRAFIRTVDAEDVVGGVHRQ